SSEPGGGLSPPPTVTDASNGATDVAPGCLQDTQALLAASSPPSGGTPAPLTPDQLASIVERAKTIWITSGLVSADGLAALDGVQFVIADLADLMLGVENGSLVTIDSDAAGWGWSVHSPPAL